jgi:hypothetical protein
MLIFNAFKYQNGRDGRGRGGSGRGGKKGEGK